MQLQDLILNPSHEGSCLRNSVNGTRSNGVNPHAEAALLSDGETCILSLWGTKDQSEEPSKDQRAPLTLKRQVRTRPLVRTSTPS